MQRDIKSFFSKRRTGKDKKPAAAHGAVGNDAPREGATGTGDAAKFLDERGTEEVFALSQDTDHAGVHWKGSPFKNRLRSSTDGDGADGDHARDDHDGGSDGDLMSRVRERRDEQQRRRASSNTGGVLGVTGVARAPRRRGMEHLAVHVKEAAHTLGKRMRLATGSARSVPRSATASISAVSETDPPKSHASRQRPDALPAAVQRDGARAIGATAASASSGAAKDERLPRALRPATTTPETSTGAKCSNAAIVDARTHAAKAHVGEEGFISRSSARVLRPTDSISSLDVDAALEAALAAMPVPARPLPRVPTRRCGPVPERYIVLAYETDAEERGQLRVWSMNAKGSRRIPLRGSWATAAASVSAGQRVAVVDPWGGEPCDLSESPSTALTTAGAVIVAPDTLLSGTAVSGGVRCVRRAAISERLRLASASRASVFGDMAHCVLQRVLVASAAPRSPLRSQDDVEAAMRAEEQVEIARRVEELWLVGANEQAAVAHFDTLRGKMARWIGEFVLSNEGGTVEINGVSTQCRITAVDAIEEELWSPTLGLRGKIDAVIRVHFDAEGSALHGRTAQLPLEIKTGAGPPQVEHLAQVQLYLALMAERSARGFANAGAPRESEECADAGDTSRPFVSKADGDLGKENRVAACAGARGRPPPPPGLLGGGTDGFALGERRAVPGLLFYAAHAETRAVLPRQVEIDTLLQRRNALAATSSAPGAPLPPPIADARVCEKCFHLAPCMLLHRTLEDGSAVSSGMPDAFRKHAAHVLRPHAEYFARMSAFIDAERDTALRFRREIWLLAAAERERRGRAAGSMRLIGVPGASDSGQYDAEFERVDPHDDTGARALTECGLVVGDFVIVSGGGTVCVTTGFVRAIERHKVSVRVRRKLEPLPDGSSWRLDRDDLPAGFGTVKESLVRLCGTDEHVQRIHALIVDLAAPRFLARIPDDLTEAYKRACIGANPDQRAAIAKIMTARDYALIHGMPGTGKTATMSRAVEALAAAGRRILVSSYTHSAVDNVLERLAASGVAVARLGRSESVSAAVRPHVLDASRAESVAAFEDAVRKARVVGCTCLGVSHAVLRALRSRGDLFDLCIVDEASQITQPVCLGPILAARAFVLVGDHYQLPPLVRAPRSALDDDATTSLFCRLSTAQPAAVAALATQYRMCPEIMALANEAVYARRLRAGNRAGGAEKLAAPRRAANRSGSAAAAWAAAAADPRRAVVFVDCDDVPGEEVVDERGRRNAVEARVVAAIVHELVDSGVAAGRIGVISPYREQLRLLSHHFRDSVRPQCSTVDRYQGRDADCIVFSCVCANAAQRVGDLLYDWRRVNVALTRARRKFILVGSAGTLRSSPVFSVVWDLAQKRNWIVRLPRGAVDCVSDTPSSAIESASASFPAAERAAARVLERSPMVANVAAE